MVVDCYIPVSTSPSLTSLTTVRLPSSSSSPVALALATIGLASSLSVALPLPLSVVTMRLPSLSTLGLVLTVLRVGSGGRREGRGVMLLIWRLL